MNRERIRRGITRYGLLFVISLILTGGFWFHREFYQIGFYPLLFIGGFVTFLVLLALRAVQTGVIWRKRPRGTLPVSRDAGERILSGTQTVAVLPLAAPALRAGSRTRAVVEATGHEVATVLVRDVRRRLAADVRAEEAARAGFDTIAEFHATWPEGRRWDPSEIVVLVEFRKEAKS